MKPQNNSAIYAIRNSASGKVYVVGWLASQTDMLADDWQIVE